MSLPFYFRTPALPDLDTLCLIEAITRSCNWTAETFLKEFTFEQGFNFAASVQQGSPVIGYIFSWLIAGELQILNVATAVEYQRQGIGLALVNHACHSAQLQRATNAFLEVRVSNEPAIALYTKAGFVSGGIRRGYYADNGEDALLMTKQLLVV